MKNLFYALFIVLILMIMSCEGSDKYQGVWKAMDSDGEKVELTFTPDELMVVDEEGNTESYEYTQHSIQYKNGARSYGISLEDGRDYTIFFPNSAADKGTIKDVNEWLVYTIGREEYVSLQEINGF